MLLTFIDSKVDEGVAKITIVRPQAVNALNWAMIAQLRSVLTEAINAPEIRAIVITGGGSRFSSGADLGSFVRYLEADDLPRIIDVIRRLEEEGQIVVTAGLAEEQMV